MEYFAFQWHITEACDQRCKHCYIYALGSHAKFQAMALEDMVRVIENCQAYGDVSSSLHQVGGIVGYIVSKGETAVDGCIAYGSWPGC